VRLFVALEIPSSVRENLAAAIQEMRSMAPQPKWVRPENLHITLKFLGKTPPEKFDALRAALSGVRSPQPVELRFHGVGFFPNDKRPRVFWVGMTSSPNLAPLALAIDQATAALGFPPETRPFTPHLTLARFDPPGISPALRAAAERNATDKFGTLNTASFHLIHSKLKTTGAEYTTLQSFPFAAEAESANA
jgi:RNA 2',3'-cyclic 3'-phosphodiesterase